MNAVDLLEKIIASGNRGNPTVGDYRVAENNIKCADGFRLSVIAGWGAYCTPRPDWFDDNVPADYAGPYTHVEVGYPSERPEPWDEWAEFCESPEEPTGTVYGQVPVDLVRALVAAHDTADRRVKP